MGLKRPALPYPARAVKRLYFGFRGARVESPWVSFDSSLGAGVVVRPQCVVRGCRVGRDTYLNRGAEMYASDIGPYCSLGHFCQIGPNEHATDSLSTSAALYPARVRRRMQEINAARTTLGADVWIGSRAVVLKGRTIGVGAVVAAGAVVAEDVAPYAIVGGVPARVIRMRFSAPDIEALLASAWWQLPSARLRAALEACDRAGEGVDVGAFCRLVAL